MAGGVVLGWRATQESYAKIELNKMKWAERRRSSQSSSAANSVPFMWWTQQQWNAIWDSQLNLQFQNSTCRRILTTADDDDDIYRKTMIFSSHQNQVEIARLFKEKHFSLWLEFFFLWHVFHTIPTISSHRHHRLLAHSPLLLLLFVFAFLLLQFLWFIRCRAVCRSLADCLRNFVAIISHLFSLNSTSL